MNEDRAGYYTDITLTIRQFSNDDNNTYTCIATNSLGTAQTSIRLYGNQKIYNQVYNQSEQKH